LHNNSTMLIYSFSWMQFWYILPQLPNILAFFSLLPYLSSYYASVSLGAWDKICI
jgi:hypothetical protein